MLVESWSLLILLLTTTNEQPTTIMKIEKDLIQKHNDKLLSSHKRKVSHLFSSIPNASKVIKKLADFQIAIPSWALGTGGTRFGRFSGGGEPGNLEEKIQDVGLLHALNKSSGAISLHIPWDIPSSTRKIKALAAEGKAQREKILIAPSLAGLPAAFWLESLVSASVSIQNQVRWVDLY